MPYARCMSVSSRNNALFYPERGSRADLYKAHGKA
jgi:hypothetical protein